MIDIAPQADYGDPSTRLVYAVPYLTLASQP